MRLAGSPQRRQEQLDALLRLHRPEQSVVITYGRPARWLRQAAAAISFFAGVPLVPDQDQEGLHVEDPDAFVQCAACLDRAGVAWTWTSHDRSAPSSRT